MDPHQIIDRISKDSNQLVSYVKDQLEKSKALEEQIQDLTSKLESVQEKLDKEKENASVARKILDDAYKEVISHVFQEPTKQITKRISRDSVKSIFTTLVVAIPSIVLTSWFSQQSAQQSISKTESLLEEVKSISRQTGKSVKLVQDLIPGSYREKDLSLSLANNKSDFNKYETLEDLERFFKIFAVDSRPMKYDRMIKVFDAFSSITLTEDLLKEWNVEIIELYRNSLDILSKIKNKDSIVLEEYRYWSYYKKDDLDYHGW